MERYQREGVRLLFRGDAAFTKSEVDEYPEPWGIGYAVRLPAGDILEQGNKHLPKRPEEESPGKPAILYCGFRYQARNWGHPGWVVAKVE